MFSPFPSSLSPSLPYPSLVPLFLFLRTVKFILVLPMWKHKVISFGV